MKGVVVKTISRAEDSQKEPIQIPADDRRILLLQAATEQFLSSGYERTTISDIIARVGGSRRNVYQLFGDKAALFVAVVEHVCDEKLPRVRKLIVPDLPLEEVLTNIARELCRTLHSPVVYRLYRTLLGALGHFPDLGNRVYDITVKPTIDLLDAFFASNLQFRKVANVDPQLASKFFLSLLQGNASEQTLTDRFVPMSEEDLDDFVKNSVRAFLYGITAISPAASSRATSASSTAEQCATC